MSSDADLWVSGRTRVSSTRSQDSHGICRRNPDVGTLQEHIPGAELNPTMAMQPRVLAKRAMRADSAPAVKSQEARRRRCPRSLLQNSRLMDPAELRREAAAPT